jgi:hypothetical protein
MLMVHLSTTRFARHNCLALHCMHPFFAHYPGPYHAYLPFATYPWPVVCMHSFVHAWPWSVLLHSFAHTLVCIFSISISRLLAYLSRSTSHAEMDGYECLSIRIHIFMTRCRHAAPALCLASSSQIDGCLSVCACIAWHGMAWKMDGWMCFFCRI